MAENSCGRNLLPPFLSVLKTEPVYFFETLLNFSHSRPTRHYSLQDGISIVTAVNNPVHLLPRRDPVLSKSFPRLKLIMF